MAWKVKGKKEKESNPKTVHVYTRLEAFNSFGSHRKLYGILPAIFINPLDSVYIIISI